MLLDCGHVPAPGDEGATVCGHLRTKQAAVGVKETVAYFIGAGIAYDVICVACAKARDSGAKVEVFALCDDCLDGFESGFKDPIGSAGAAEILEDPRRPRTLTWLAPLPAEAIPTVSVAPIDGTPSSWLLLTGDGRILRWDAASGACEPVGRTGISAADVPTGTFRGHRPARRVLASRDGGYAAVVVDYGRHGEVLDLGTGRVVLSLDGGGYHPETVPFAIAFVRWRDRDTVIHRTAWNRLDATDLASGELLTARTFEDDSPGHAPQHHGHLFHGALHVDPTHSRIADDGWVWQPFGSLVTWEIEPWLASNPFESKNDSSPAFVVGAEAHWDRACVWLDERTLAVGGIGDDDFWIIPGARIFDVSRAGPSGWDRLADAEVRAFAGPGKPFFAAHGLLYAVGDDGLEVWDPEAGTRLGRVPGFRPTLHHRGGGQLAEFGESWLRQWRIADPRA